MQLKKPSKRGAADVLVHNAGTNDGVGLDSSPSDFLESLRRTFPCFRPYAFAWTSSSSPRVTNQRRIESRSYRARRNLRLCRSQGPMNALTREWARPRGTGSSGKCCHSGGSHDPLYCRCSIRSRIPMQPLNRSKKTFPQAMTTDAEIADSVVFASARSSHTPDSFTRMAVTPTSIGPMGKSRSISPKIHEERYLYHRRRYRDSRRLTVSPSDTWQKGRHPEKESFPPSTRPDIIPASFIPEFITNPVPQGDQLPQRQIGHGGFLQGTWIEHELCGKVIVALNEEEIPRMEKSTGGGQENG